MDTTSRRSRPAPSSGSELSGLRPTGRLLLLAVVAAVSLTGCGDDDPPSAGDASSTSTEPAPRTVDGLAVPDVDVPEAGTARVVLGSSLDVTLSVSSCIRDLGAQPDGQVPVAQVMVTAEGERADGVPVLLDVKRFRSQGASPTITDTITVLEGTEEAPVRAVQAQRFEVDGFVTDPRDPYADDPLLRVTEQRIEARGVFAPPGTFAAGGDLVEGLVVISCTS